MPATTRSLLYAATPDIDRVADAVRADARDQGYRPLEGAIPQAYPRQTQEVREWALAPGGDAWTLVAPEERDRIFFWGRDVSAQLRGTVIVALTVDPWGDWKAKAYMDGKPIAKIGGDPDDEYFYPVAQSGARELETLERLLGWDRLRDHPLRAWSRQLVAGEAKSAGSLTRALGLPTPDRGWPELAATPGAIRETWARADSPLHDW